MNFSIRSTVKTKNDNLHLKCWIVPNKVNEAGINVHFNYVNSTHPVAGDVTVTVWTSTDGHSHKKEDYQIVFFFIFAG